MIEAIPTLTLFSYVPWFIVEIFVEDLETVNLKVISRFDDVTMIDSG